MSAYDQRNADKLEAMQRATSNPASFLAQFSCKRVGGAFVCPRCKRPKLYARPPKGAGYLFSCERGCVRDDGRPAHGMDAIAFHQFVHGSDFKSAREWLMSYAGMTDAAPLSVPMPLAVHPASEWTPGHKATLDAFRMGAEAVLSRAPRVADARTHPYLAALWLPGSLRGAVAADAGMHYLGNPHEAAALFQDVTRAIGWGALKASGVGLYGERTGHGLVVPWLGEDGRVAALRYRYVPAPGRTDADVPEPWSKYLMTKGAPTPAVPFMHPGDVVRCRSTDFTHVAICEGEFDALALRRSSLIPESTLCVATGGTGMVARFNPGREWHEVIKGRRVYLATDADRAGDEAADKLAAALAGRCPTRRLRPARAGDWCSELECDDITGAA